MSKEKSFCISCGLPITKQVTVWTHDEGGKKHPAFPVDNHIKEQRVTDILKWHI